jgi:hypothetical protein
MSLTPEQEKRINDFFHTDDFEEVMGHLSVDLYEEWCKEREPKERERLWLQRQALDQLMTRLRAISDQVSVRKNR